MTHPAEVLAFAIGFTLPAAMVAERWLSLRQSGSLKCLVPDIWPGKLIATGLVPAFRHRELFLHRNMPIVFNIFQGAGQEPARGAMAS
ncbi:MAG: hypothetical protein ACTHM2_10850 [Afipia sp.]